MERCSYCGTALPPDARFCAYCGRPVTTANAMLTESTALSTSNTSAPTGFVTDTDWPLQGSGTQDDQPTDEEEEERKRRLLFGLPMLGALAGEGQAPAPNIPMVQGTPQVSGVPSVEGTPAAPLHGPLSGFHPQTPPHAPANLQQQVQSGFRHQGTPPHAPADLHQQVQSGFRAQGAPPRGPAPQPIARGQAHRHRGLRSVRARVLTVTVSTVVVVAGVISALAFLLPASISLSGGGSVHPGGILHVHGNGFLPGSRVMLLLDNHQPLFFVHSGSHEVRSDGATVALAPKDAALVQALMAQPVRSGASKTGEVTYTILPISLTDVIQVGLSGTFDVAVAVSSSWSSGSHTISATESLSSLSVQSVQLTFMLEPTAAKLVVAPVHLDFGMLKKGNKATQALAVSNTGQQLLNWSADVGATSWLTLDVSNGTIQPGGSQTIHVTANTSKLAAGGHYSASVAINAGSESMQVAVTLGVNASPTPTPTPSPTPTPVPPTQPSQPVPPTVPPTVVVPTPPPSPPTPKPAPPPPPTPKPPPPTPKPPPPTPKPAPPPPPTPKPTQPPAAPPTLVVSPTIIQASGGCSLGQNANGGVQAGGIVLAASSETSPQNTYVCGATLTNTGSSDLNWVASAEYPGTQVSPSAGTLGPGQSVGVTLYIPCNVQSDVVFFKGPANEVHVLVLIGQPCY